MNQKRSHSSQSSSQASHKETLAKKKGQVESKKIFKGDRFREQSLNLHKINSLPKFLGVFGQNSSWRYFNRGLFWGVLVSLTSVLSAIVGVALTNIDLVEQQISQRLLGSNSQAPKAVESPSLTTPMQILLVEVEPEADALLGFSQATQGKSKTVLLLKVDPEFKSAQAINIPLNSKTQIPGFGQGTIKDAYKLGGIKLLSKTIRQLPGQMWVDRYFRTTPEIFKQLTDSGKITLDNCEPRIEDCLDISSQIIRQETAFETIRQRFNIPNYLTNFKKAIARVKPQLDTNFSFPEIIAVVNFIKELEPEEIGVDLLPGYIPGETIETNQPKLLQKPLTLAQRSMLSRHQRFQNKPIVVQNTTDNPELARRVVVYLKQQNFRHVYLKEKIPLKLEQTKILSNYPQLETANYLKNVLGFGSLEAISATEPQELILQLGQDASALPKKPR